MPIQIADLISGKRTITVEFGGDTAEVTYRPGAYTPELEDQFWAMLESNRAGLATADLLAKVLVSWDVLDDEGKMYPVDKEHLRKLNTDFLTAIANQIGDDMQAERDARKNYGDGSPQKASKGKGRGGTFS